MNPIRREFYLIERLLQNPLFSLDLECQKEKQKWLNFGSRVQGVVLCRKSEPLDLFKTVSSLCSAVEQPLLLFIYTYI